MKDIFSAWDKGKMSSEYLERILSKQQFKVHTSNLLLEKLKRNLGVGMVWALVLSLCYVVLIFYTPYLLVRVCLLIIILFNLIVLVQSYKLYRQCSNAEPVFLNVRENLRRQLSAFQSWWKLQERMSIGVYPVAILGGFFFGGTIGSGKTITDLLAIPIIWIALACSLVVLVPLSYFIARWMFRKAYGTHLEQLEITLAELSTEDLAEGETEAE